MTNSSQNVFPTLSRLIVEPWAMPAARARTLISQITGAMHAPAKMFDDGDDDGCASNALGDCIDGYVVKDGVATIPIIGVLTKYPSAWGFIDKYFGLVPSKLIQSTIARALADWTVRSIDLLIDCPGGLYAGTNELCDYIARVSGTGQGRKPFTARISDLAASGGYWIASQCGTVTCNPGGFSGCIGVYSVLLDDRAFWEKMGVSWELVSSGGVKGMGADGKITPELRADVQREIDGMFDRFTGGVATGRGMKIEQARILGDGRSWIAAEAKKSSVIRNTWQGAA